MFGIDPRLAEADGLVEGGDRALPHLAAVDAQGEVRPRAIELPRRPFGPRRVGEDDVLQLFWVVDRKSTRLNSSHSQQSRMPSSA